MTDEIEFNVWSCRDIILSFSPSRSSIDCSSSNKVTERITSSSVVETKVPIISFLRFGDQSVSKSSIMNMIINDGEHGTFYDSDTFGSSLTYRLMEGVVEAYWYSPGRTTGVLGECAAFTNLYGNASSHAKQLKLLSLYSSLIRR